MVLELNEKEMRSIYGGEGEESGEVIKYYVVDEDGIHIVWERP